MVRANLYTGKSLSEALIFASTNPQYDDRLFIELQVQDMKMPSSEHVENMLHTEIVFYIQNNFCTQHVLPMFCKKKSFWQRFTCKLKQKSKKLFHFAEILQSRRQYGPIVKYTTPLSLLCHYLSLFPINPKSNLGHNYGDDVDNDCN